MEVRRILARGDFAQLTTQARDLLNGYRATAPEASEFFGAFHPHPPAPDTAKLSDAQLTLARAHDFPSWPRFKHAVELFNAILSNAPEAVLALIRAHPKLLHENVHGATSNWGPPLACAVQVGSQRVFDALIAIDGQDLQWALGRATLKGRSTMARALMGRDAAPEPGEAMGPCESLNVEGLRFLAEIGAPLTDARGNAMAPVGLVLEGYTRDPQGKHACLAFFAERGIAYPDTPVMAFHRGRIDLLKAHLARDPDLPHRRFSYREIYPLELGCHADESLGLHGTPLGGTTLLHLCADFDEMEIARWLIAKGADVNARAQVDADGFGGHTPLFNDVVFQANLNRRRDDTMARLFLDQGADPNARASIRKGIRFYEDEAVHEYRDVTPAAYARAFHTPAWVSQPVLHLLEARERSASG